MQTSVRTFRASDARSALQAVKAALGAQAVILSTREVKSGLFQPPEVEITAALHVDTPQIAPPPATVTRAYRQAASSAPTSWPGEGNSRGGDVWPEAGWPAHARTLWRTLTEQGVPDDVAHAAVLAGRDRDPWPGPHVLQEGARQFLHSRLHCAPAPWLDANRRIMALVGPTGVGKTTTVAKMAARAMLDGRLKVGLISVDTWRVGAWQQLAKYGEILGVPTLVARTREELCSAAARLRGCQLVLVDTAGRSEEDAILRQAELLRSVDAMEMYLTVSATNGTRDVAACARRYRALDPHGIVVTKLDEAVAPGCVLATDLSPAQPLVALTDGQSIPEDLHAATAEKFLPRIIG
ncbi:MAG: flagellar biosynthesis protein FlhF [Myxococcota bacterium]